MQQRGWKPLTGCYKRYNTCNTRRKQQTLRLYAAQEIKHQTAETSNKIDNTTQNLNNNFYGGFSSHFGIGGLWTKEKSVKF